MGEASRNRKEFLAENPTCIFCGGAKPATEIEHCLPRAMFREQIAPHGFEFPICKPCNSGSRDDDLLIAFLGRINPFSEEDKDRRTMGIIRRVEKRFPGMILRMMPSAVQARANNRRFGITPGPGQTHQEVSPINLPSEFDRAFRVFGGKLSKGVFYKETESIFPAYGCLVMAVVTNIELVKSKTYPAFDVLSGIAAKAPGVSRNRRPLEDQFSYKVSLSEDGEIYVLQAIFGNAFGLIIFGSPVDSLLEPMIDKLRDDDRPAGPFSVLQSPYLGPSES